jgi:hypothetical protein
MKKSIEATTKLNMHANIQEKMNIKMNMNVKMNLDMNVATHVKKNANCSRGDEMSRQHRVWGS